MKELDPIWLAMKSRFEGSMKREYASKLIIMQNHHQPGIVY